MKKAAKCGLFHYGCPVLNKVYTFALIFRRVPC